MFVAFSGSVRRGGVRFHTWSDQSETGTARPNSQSDYRFVVDIYYLKNVKINFVWTRGIFRMEGAKGELPPSP